MAVHHVAQHTDDDTLREGGVVVVHVVGEFTQTDGSLVLYASVVLAQHALDGVVGVLCQIQFQCRNFSVFFFTLDLGRFDLGQRIVNTVVTFGVFENTLGLFEITLGLSGISAALS